MQSPENQLLTHLSDAQRLAVLGRCIRVPLGIATPLGRQGEISPRVYFPLNGCMARVSQSQRAPGLELSLIGCEGMVDIHSALGQAPAPWGVRVQSPGEAWCLDVSAFHQLLADLPALRQQMKCYTLVVIAQLALAVVCVHLHNTRQRLARHLLIRADCTPRSPIFATHEALAVLLGVRRVSITESATSLQQAGCIAYARGQIEILSRPALEQAACACYAEGLRQYHQHMG